MNPSTLVASARYGMNLLMPVTLQNPRRHWLHEDTRPGTAAGQPPQENGVPTPLSCSRLRPSTGLATEIASMKLSTIHTTRQPFRRCPRPAPPVDAQTSLHCLAENIARKRCWLPPASLPTFYSGHTPRHQGLKHFSMMTKRSAAQALTWSRLGSVCCQTKQKTPHTRQVERRHDE